MSLNQNPKFDNVYHAPIAEQVRLVEDLYMQWWHLAYLPDPEAPSGAPKLIARDFDDRHIAVNPIPEQLRQLAYGALAQALWPMNRNQFETVQDAVSKLAKYQAIVTQHGPYRPDSHQAAELAQALYAMLAVMAIKHTGVEQLLRQSGFDEAPNFPGGF